MEDEPRRRIRGFFTRALYHTTTEEEQEHNDLEDQFNDMDISGEAWRQLARRIDAFVERVTTRVRLLQHTQ